MHVVVGPVQRFGHAGPKGVSVTLCWLHVAGLPQPLTRPRALQACCSTWASRAAGWLGCCQRPRCSSRCAARAGALRGYARAYRAGASRGAGAARTATTASSTTRQSPRAPSAPRPSVRVDDLYAVLVHPKLESESEGHRRTELVNVAIASRSVCAKAEHVFHIPPRTTLCLTGLSSMLQTSLARWRCRACRLRQD